MDAVTGARLVRYGHDQKPREIVATTADPPPI